MSKNPYKTDYNAKLSGWETILFLGVGCFGVWLAASGYLTKALVWGIILIPVFFGLRFLYSLFKLDRHFSGKK